MWRKALAACLVSVPLTASANEISSTRWNAWRISSHQDERSRQFTHCSASASYRSGIILTFGISSNFTWRVVFSNPDWNMRAGQTISVSYQIDNFEHRRGTAEIIERNIAVLQLPDDAELFRQMRIGQLINFNANGQNYPFLLTGTAVVLQTLLDCARNRGQIAIAAPPPRPQPQPAAPATSTAAQTAERRLEATQFVANLLSDSGLRGFRIMTSAEQRRDENPPLVRNADVAWQGDGTLGTLLIISPSNAANLDAYASDLIGADARGCPGEFMTARVPDPDMRNARRLMTFCGLGGGENVSVHYMLLPMPGGVAYQFTIVGRAGREAASVEDRRLRDAVHAVVLRHPAIGATPSPAAPRQQDAPTRQTISN
jgi:hypothetical protein